MKSIGYAFFSICMATAVTAADSTADAAQRCKALTDVNARVACYDKLFEAAPASTAPAPAARAPAAPAAAATAVAPAAAFGGESLAKTREAKEAAVPTSLTAQVAEVKEIKALTYRISLDNGQVWMQEEMKASFKVGVGDTVQIERGRIGGYTLARMTDGKPRGTWIRVTRYE